MENGRVLVIGAGAIGGYVGGSLALSGHGVTLLCRPETAARLRTHGLTLVLPDGERQPQLTVAGTAPQALDAGPFDLMVLAVKRYDTAAALSPLMPFAAALPPVLCLQNGIGAEEEIVRLLHGVDVIPGTVTTAVGRPQPDRVEVERMRGMGVAGAHPAAQVWTGSLTAAGLNARYYASAQSMKWSKLITNLIANPVSAILDMAPAEIFAHRGLFRLELLQLREALAVMDALGVAVEDLPGTPVRLLAFCARRLPPTLAQPLLRRALGRSRGGKMPSFHGDLHSGKGKSEIGYLHGAVVEYGRQVGVPTPVNQLLTELLQGMISGDLSPNLYRRRPERLLQHLGRFDHLPTE